MLPIQPFSMPFIVTFDDDGRKRALDYLRRIRDLGFSADTDFMERSMKAQMKAAARANARFTVIVETEAGRVVGEKHDNVRTEYAGRSTIFSKH